MGISQKELSKKKAMAKLLLEANGKNIDDWLAEKYDEVVYENQEVILQALKKNNKPTYHN